jgi:transcriptional regulator with XRE-family HTH domain
MKFRELTSDSAVLEELGRRLREARLERNLSQAQVSEEAGIGRMTLQRMEAGESSSVTSLIRVLRALDLLDGLEPLLPAPSSSPIEDLRRRGRRRRRAGAPRSSLAKGAPRPWRWGDERAEEDG